MTNKEIYSKPLTFSIRRFLVDIGSFLVLGILGGAGFLVAEKTTNRGLIGLGIGLILGLVALVFILRYSSYSYKAGQIAMMSRAVSEGSLPDNVLEEGRNTVKQRFGTVVLFYAATSLIRGIFNQLSRGVEKLGKAVGGDTGSTVADIISTGISIMVGYLCDCCLGWVFYRRDQNSARSTLEGAVLFFRHGKTLMKNMGRVFGMGIASLVAIGGVFFGVFYLIFSRMPAAFERLAAELAEAAVRMEETVPELFQDPKLFMLVCAGVCAVILWSVLHSVFVRPYILVGVLRNYMESGMNDIPTEAAFSMLDSKSAKFRKLHEEAMA